MIAALSTLEINLIFGIIMVVLIGLAQWVYRTTPGEGREGTMPDYIGADGQRNQLG